MSADSVARGLAIEPGAQVEVNGRRFIITHVLRDFKTLIAEDIATGQSERISISDVRIPRIAVTATKPSTDLSELREEQWNEALRRLASVKDLLALPRRSRSDVAAHARDLGVHACTLYRWIRIYRDSGKTETLVSAGNSGGRGKSRLNAEVEKIIQIAIQSVYLQGQQRTVKSTADEVARLCRNAGIKEAPHVNTVRSRIKAISERTRLKKRAQGKLADDRFAPRSGHFVEAQRPLSIVQVDHTKLDIELVDEQHRLPIGRPWLTLVFDVFSRMVLGFHVSLDPPGANGTGLALAHAILPKEAWLSKRGITTDWPCWGFPATVHLDNAREFRGEMLRRACEQYDIELNYRPVADPHFGGHIERNLGTLARVIHELPGSTFSNPKQRGQYDSQAEAAMTLSDLEKYLAEHITGIYHQNVHRGIKMAPIKRWSDARLGTSDRPAMGKLVRPMGEERIRLDFMPLQERTVQNYGVQIDQINYYSDVLRPYINEKANGRKRLFLFRRDPGDISKIYFWDPELKQYSVIPYRDLTHPPISVWELREVRRRLEEDGRKDIDEAAIFETYERLRRHREQAVSETRKARRDRARRVNRVRPPVLAVSEPPKPPVTPAHKVIQPYRVEIGDA